MIKIFDGRNEFYQWDLNRKLIVSDLTVTELHFCNKTDDCSLVVEVKEIEVFAHGASAVIRTADVPNILLQTDWPIHVYAYCGDCYTKESATFKVNKRTKPADYVYTETEILQYSTVIERVDKLENNIGEEIEKYMEEHPIEIPDNIATETYVDDALLNYESVWKDYVDNSLEGKQNKIDSYIDGDRPRIELWDNNARYYFENTAFTHATAPADGEFRIIAMNGQINKTLHFNFYENNLTYSHYDYELNERNTKTIAFVEDVEEKLGGIDAALDAIIAKQADVLGGDF